MVSPRKTLKIAPLDLAASPRFQHSSRLTARPRKHTSRAKGNDTSPPLSRQAETVTTRSQPHYGIFYAARDTTTVPLPWPSIAPPFTRYEKTSRNFLSMIKLASVRLWIEFYESAA